MTLSYNTCSKFDAMPLTSIAVLSKTFFITRVVSDPQEEVGDLLAAAPFQNIIPRPFLKEKEKLETKMEKLEKKYAALQIVPIIDKLGTDKQLEVVVDVIKLGIFRV